MTLHFHREVDRLIEDLISFGEGIEDQLNLAMDALVEKDVKAAKRIRKNDTDLDAIEVEMEEECLKLLALHQPLANDLRQIVS
ncbi:MAG: PhoU domain-containing protein, partial [Gammaproteobacteria bacterium]